MFLPMSVDLIDNPFVAALPSTFNLAFGEVVPIPTSPPVVITSLDDSKEGVPLLP